MSRKNTVSPKNIVVIGLDEVNHALLRQVPDADRYRFHGLLTLEELQKGEIPIVDLLDKARKVLTSFDDTIDAIVGYWDFPVSTMLPLLCREFGVRAASLESVLKCEHKYWSRLEQRKVITEHPEFALVELDDDKPPLRFPFWLKPVKSFSSDLAFEVTDDAEFRSAVAEIADGIGRVGEPFDYLLDQADLPPEIADAGGQVALAERALSGARAAVEGYSLDGDVEIYAVLDSLVYPQVSSFLRHQYPSQLPEEVQRRLVDVSKRVMKGVGFDPGTFSIEYFCDPETGEVSLLEINPRHSQSHAEMFALVNGFPNHHYMLKVALGEDPRRPLDGGPYDLAARWYLRRFDDGLLTRGPTTEEIKSIEDRIGGVSVYRRAADGSRLSELSGQDSYSYELAEIVVGADGPAQLREKYDRCVAALRFDFEGG
ncbi:ATP-grasp domain-containing protein [Actinokineospora xionganensis]|uniref:ATP-grasp domain-containing protein n=1 Tax=Actinokineospora xionganensis TaxID=2684470 RepID=A0ABR7LF49_9PSEU|nr:ATP-grasp domain-containing protein [Actinokineospora xionganensis]MBC6451218.1 ATP-grasp domain-containing protein [Actinokineospora xionganensis]